MKRVEKRVSDRKVGARLRVMQCDWSRGPHPPPACGPRPSDLFDAGIDRVLLLRTRRRFGAVFGFLHQVLEIRVAAQQPPFEFTPQEVAAGQARCVNRAQRDVRGVLLADRASTDAGVRRVSPICDTSRVAIVSCMVFSSDAGAARVRAGSARHPALSRRR